MMNAVILMAVYIYIYIGILENKHTKNKKQSNLKECFNKACMQNNKFFQDSKMNKRLMLG